MAYSAEQVIKAIAGSGGFVTTIARRLNCSPRTVYRLRDRFDSVADALNTEREIQLDEAEAVLRKQIRDGNTTALIFFLKTQGKSRGYVERQEVAGVKDQPVNITLVPAKDGD